MSEAVYHTVFWGGMALIAVICSGVFFYGVGRGEGIREQKEAEATARAARNAKPGDTIPCRDPQAVAEALRNGAGLGSLFFDEKGHAYRLPASPREEIAMAVLLAVLQDPSVKIYGDAQKGLVINCFGIADAFLAKANEEGE